MSTWLEDYGIVPRWLKSVSEEALIKKLNEGNIIIVGLDLKYISCNSDYRQRVGVYSYLKPSRSYYHYVVVKGYKEVDNIIYFETYDPGSG